MSFYMTWIADFSRSSLEISQLLHVEPQNSLANSKVVSCSGFFAGINPCLQGHRCPLWQSATDWSLGASPSHCKDKAGRNREGSPSLGHLLQPNLSTESWADTGRAVREQQAELCQLSNPSLLTALASPCPTREQFSFPAEFSCSRSPLFISCLLFHAQKRN